MLHGRPTQKATLAASAGVRLSVSFSKKTRAMAVMALAP
jgi:hypothetical protein